MATYDRQAVEARLESRLEEVRRRRAGLRLAAEGMISGELAHLDNHPADEGTETHERELDATTETFLDEEERRIEEARRSLANGTYGTCLDCGGEIPPERLDAVVEAVRCLSCQRTLEGMRRQTGPPRLEA